MNRTDWPAMPVNIAALPTQEGTGYPIPWFVETMPDGSRDFRVMSGKNFRAAVMKSRCWICGRRIVSVPKRLATFVVGPMCAVNHTSAEPPSHRVCAEWAAAVCPFLTTPGRERRLAGLPEECNVAGIMIERNPGVVLLWSSDTWTLRREPDGVLFDIGEPRSVRWLCEGRTATRAEVIKSVETGLPSLVEVAAQHGEMAALELAVGAIKPLLPKAEP